MLNIQKIRYGRNKFTFSSDDRYLYFEVDDDTFNTNEDEETLQNIQEINGRLVRCTYHFKHLEDFYKDLKTTDDARQTSLAMLYSKHDELTKTIRQDTRKDKGYINYIENFEDIKPEDYYGLLKKYFTQDTLNYIDNRIVFGYLGHSDRTRETDQVICDFLEENPDMINTVNYEFFTSGTGRHYMDNYNGPEDLRKFLENL